ncbi:galactitol-1-phosphate 5-dehydrogenase [Chimaeribacter arupi]|uniref:galactitol-1-phosphate 5-dehydrogenase n=1 Tax=Chimaeribacter arupi TaxID=2060066 RepID=UPI002711DCA6|nr:galactitol-1-phosphate 5-dehydrogenase [Chimaeribacter arupi]WKZ91440.1 galactitol-1-phosphate 5-dehydrogenase [Chimaeribacter arupi]
MKSVVIHANGEVSVEERPQPSVTQPDDVLVRIAYSGLCGSDIPRIFASGAHYYPITLGHEFSGEVVRCGDGITDLAAGDRVACVPLQPCFTCEECRRHLYSQCKHYQFIGSRSEGGHAEYIVVRRPALFKLPADASLLQGAFFEPVTVGLHALHLAGGCENKHVVVIGAGTIGQLVIQCARALGAASVTALDINDGRLTQAQTSGATLTVNSAALNAQEIAAQLHKQRFDQLILETAGTPQTIALAIEIAGPRAQLALIGTLHKDLTLTAPVFGQILRKELTLLGSWMNYSTGWPGVEWQQAQALFSKGALTLAPLIAHIGDAAQFAQDVSALQGRPMQGKLLLNFTAH